jgi:diaminohydroxyphosphoribosylaminopyrimidine deaminase/5-amino-6-(5-phosphoribosylamino)uracil reductase
LNNGRSQWLTGTAARRDGHRWRARAGAILTGIGTVLLDDPQLNVRGVAEVDDQFQLPLKVIVDSRLQLSPTARLFDDGQVLVVCAVAEAKAAEPLRRRGAEILSLPSADGRVDLSALLGELAVRGINEVHAESGAGLGGALLALGLVDELLLYLAPSLLGDEARGVFKLPALSSLADKRMLNLSDVRLVGNDLRLLARLT